MFHKIGTVTTEEMNEILGTELGKLRRVGDLTDLITMFNDWVNYREGNRPSNELTPVHNVDGLRMQLARRYNTACIGASEWMLVYDEQDACIRLDTAAERRWSYYDKDEVNLLKWQREALAYLLPKHGYMVRYGTNNMYCPIGTMVRYGENRMQIEAEFKERLDDIAQEKDGPGRIANMLLAGSWRPRESPESRCDWESYGGVDKPWNYFRLTTSGAISYLPKPLGAGERYEDPWNRSNRVQQKCGRFIRAFFTDKQLRDNEIGDKEIEAFSIMIQTKTARPLEHVHLISGKDITYWYNGDNYYHDAGELNSSCMRYDECERYFGIYTENPKQVQMLCVFDRDPVGDEESAKLMARGIVWTDVNGERWLDRVYGSYKMIPRVYAHAKEHLGLPDLRREGAHITVELDNPWHGSYPYMDTMHTLHEDGTLRNYNALEYDDDDYDDEDEERDIENGVIYLHSTGGGPSLTSSRYRCKKCGGMSFAGRNQGGFCSRCRAEGMRALLARLDNPRSRISTLTMDEMDWLNNRGKVDRQYLNGENYYVVESSGMPFTWNDSTDCWERIPKRVFAEIRRDEDRRVREIRRKREERDRNKQAIREQIRDGIFPGNFDLVDTFPGGAWEWSGDELIIRHERSDKRVVCRLERPDNNRAPWGYELIYVRTEVQDHSGWRAITVAPTEQVLEGVAS